MTILALDLSSQHLRSLVFRPDHPVNRTLICAASRSSDDTCAGFVLMMQGLPAVNESAEYQAMLPVLYCYCIGTILRVIAVVTTSSGNSSAALIVPFVCSPLVYHRRHHCQFISFSLSHEHCQQHYQTIRAIAIMMFINYSY